MSYEGVFSRRTPGRLSQTVLVSDGVSRNVCTDALRSRPPPRTRVPPSTLGRALVGSVDGAPCTQAGVCSPGRGVSPSLCSPARRDGPCGWGDGSPGWRSSTRYTVLTPESAGRRFIVRSSLARSWAARDCPPLCFRDALGPRTGLGGEERKPLPCPRKGQRRGGWSCREVQPRPSEAGLPPG